MSKKTNHNIRDTFIGVPVTTMHSEEWKSLKPHSRVVYLTMLLKHWHNYGDGTVEWGQAEIATESGIPLRTVQRGLKELKEAKFIEVVTPGGRWSASARYSVNPAYSEWYTEVPREHKIGRKKSQKV